ncbi:MAG: Fe-S cluster assembly ATPase SufC [Alphaproteobacteria bacterium]
MLKIENLHARIEGVDEGEILKGLDLEVKPGEVHAVMGPNGSGKSTLAYILAGRDGYEVTDGSISFDGEDVLEMEPEERAAAGLFLAFQYPIEIPGVANMYFLRTALNAIKKARGEPEVDAASFMRLLREQAEIVGIRADLLKRDVNAGFSGGEKKRNEILQMAVLQPKLAVLDETDSGLDIDALRTVADGVNRLRSPERGIVVITHYQRLLQYIVPDHVHVLVGGRIVRSGDKTLAHELEAKGYSDLLAELGISVPADALEATA